MKTAEQFLHELRSRGETILDWAKSRDLDPHAVYALLYGRTKGHRGESHRAAVLMGLKKGVPGKRATRREQQAEAA